MTKGAIYLGGQHGPCGTYLIEIVDELADFAVSLSVSVWEEADYACRIKHLRLEPGARQGMGPLWAFGP